MVSGVDRRAARHEESAAAIVEAAWRLVEEDGVAGLSVSALATAVQMRPQSLYHYFPSKDAIYDRMYRDGFDQLLQVLDQITTREDRDPVVVLVALAEGFVDFAAELPSRFQLLFQRSVPGFEPSPESYAVASHALREMRAALRRAGITAERDIDLWRALLVGLASEQLANDPGGKRWRKLAQRMAEFFVGFTTGKKGV